MKSKSMVVVVLVMVISCQAETIIVDPNGSFDFTTIQAAIDYSWDGDTVIVRPGTYNPIKFNGRRIILTSLDPNDESIVDSTIISGDTAVTFDFGEDSNSVITGFTIIGNLYSIECSSCSSPSIIGNKILGRGDNSVGIAYCGGIISSNIISNFDSGIECSNTETIISNNVIANNNYGISISNTETIISNNVIAHNHHGIYYDGSAPDAPVIIVRNNIIANNYRGLSNNSTVDAFDNSYNCFWGNYTPFEGTATAGTGDFIRDPLFAGGSDYHLKSTAGRWTGSGWFLDDTNSPCIDAGDPCEPIGYEPNPNGGRINIGAYGGTAQASKSPSGIIEPVCSEKLVGDINGDCKIDFVDFALMANNWLDCNLDPPSACWE